MKLKVAIVGRGFAGLTSAIVLKEAGYDVCLVGPDKTITTASTAAHGANTIKGLHEASQELFALKILGHKNFLSWLKHIEDVSGFDVPKIGGVYERFESYEKFKIEQNRIYKNRFLGIFAVETKSKTNVWFENYYPQDFWIESDRYLLALDSARRKLAIDIATEECVVEVSEADGKAAIVFEDGKRLCFDIVVLAVGAELAAINLPIDIKSEFYGAPGLTMTATSSLENGKSLCAVKELNAIAVNGNKMYAGSTTTSNAIKLSKDLKNGQPSSTINSEVMGQFKSIYQRVLIEHLPEDAVSELTPRWGVRIRSRDRTPVIGPISKRKNIYLNTGYYKSGISLTPVGARFLLKILENQSADNGKGAMSSQRYFAIG